MTGGTMKMKMTFTATAELEHVAGPQEDPEWLAEEIRDYLENDADPGTIDGPHGGEYRVDWTVTRDS